MEDISKKELEELAMLRKEKEGIRNAYEKLAYSLFSKIYDTDLICEYYSALEEKRGSLNSTEHIYYFSGLRTRYDFSVILRENGLIQDYKEYKEDKDNE